MNNEQEVCYTLENFEGPLEVLLDMIQKKKIDIKDIPIAEICDQYLEYVEEKQRFDMEIATEFIIMASELIKIKTAMLLPHDPINWEDPRKPLVNALELYQQARENAKELQPLYDEFSGRFTKDQDEIPPEKGLPLNLNVNILAEALSRMITRLQNTPKSNDLVQPLVSGRIVSISKMVTKVIEKLENNDSCSFYYLLKDAVDRPELVATFMGILELLKMGRIQINFEEPINEDEEFMIEMTVKFKINKDYVPSSENEESEFDDE